MEQRLAAITEQKKPELSDILDKIVDDYDFIGREKNSTYVSLIKINDLIFYACFKGFSMIPLDSFPCEDQAFESKKSLYKILKEYVETGALPAQQEELKKLYDDVKQKEEENKKKEEEKKEKILRELDLTKMIDSLKKLKTIEICPVSCECLIDVLGKKKRNWNRNSL